MILILKFVFLCDLCTEVCPTEAIVMTNNFELAEYCRDDLFKNLSGLMRTTRMSGRRIKHERRICCLLLSLICDYGGVLIEFDESSAYGSWP